jgi:hypothetical protein
MGSFFRSVSYAAGINYCGYRTIQDFKMGSFGDFANFFAAEPLSRQSGEDER